jgi:hypothetical protein
MTSFAFTDDFECNCDSRLHCFILRSVSLWPLVTVVMNFRALLKASKQSLLGQSGGGGGAPSTGRELDGDESGEQLKAVEKLAAERTERVRNLEMMMGSTTSTKPVLASDLSCIYNAHEDIPERALSGEVVAERREGLRESPFATPDSKRQTPSQRGGVFSAGGRPTPGGTSMRGSPVAGRILTGTSALSSASSPSRREGSQPRGGSVESPARAIVAMSEAHSLASLANNGSRARVAASRPEGRWSHGEGPSWNVSASEKWHGDHARDSQAQSWYHTRI